VIPTAIATPPTMAGTHTYGLAYPLPK
jgi:hypothetical protein